MDGSLLAVVLMVSGFVLIGVMFWPRLSFAVSMLCFAAGLGAIVAAISINARHADTSPDPSSSTTSATGVAAR